MDFISQDSKLLLLQRMKPASTLQQPYLLLQEVFRYK